MRIVARNLGLTPIVVDHKGHQLGAGEFGVVDPDDRVSKALLAAGNIGEVSRPAAGVDVDPGAAAAFELLDAGDDEAGGAAAEPQTSEPDEPAKTTAARRR